jgi:acetyl-CoA C-acetyltransferase
MAVLKFGAFTMALKDLYILAAARTPVGKFLGSLSHLTAPELGAKAITGALVTGTTVEQVIMGNVLQAGIGQAPARQAALKAELPKSTGAITLNKMCGSGLRAVMDAANGITAGEWQTVMAGGMESMSKAPHLLERSRLGQKMGDIIMADHVLKDGLLDPYGHKHMGNCAELCARKYHFSREQQDAFALESYRRAQAATEGGKFAREIVAVTTAAGVVSRDEEPFGAPLEKMPKLKPAFESDGSITAANSSKINDGAAALLVSNQAINPLARIVSYVTVAHEPEWFTTAPIPAIQAALKKAGLHINDIDLFEINEAFAVVTMAAMQDLHLDPAKVNIRGGAVAMGHPIGCSGARILTTLVHALEQENKRYGCAAICIGGGEAAAMMVENLRR